MPGCGGGRSSVAVALESILPRETARWVDIAAVDPVLGILAGGALVGIGLLCLFRHKASLGRFGMVAEDLEERHGIRSGTVPLVCDTGILLAGARILPPRNVALSILGALVMNGVLIVRHRSDRYVGVS